MPKYKGYKALSKGGTIYVDLSDESNYAQLTPAEKRRVKNQQEWYREEVRISKEEYFDTLETTFQKELAIKRQQFILSGQAETEAQKIFLDNYASGLRVRGQSNLATLLDWISGQTHTIRGRTALYEDLPDLDLFYADKRSKTGRSSTDLQLAGDEESTYEDIEQALRERMNTRHIPKYVTDFILDGGLSEMEDSLRQQGKSVKDLSLKELKYIAKNAS